METTIVSIRKKMAGLILGFASIFNIAMARFERNPQSCGMLIERSVRKNNHR